MSNYTIHPSTAVWCHSRLRDDDIKCHSIIHTCVCLSTQRPNEYMALVNDKMPTFKGPSKLWRFTKTKTKHTRLVTRTEYECVWHTQHTHTHSDGRHSSIAIYAGQRHRRLLPCRITIYAEAYSYATCAVALFRRYKFCLKTRPCRSMKDNVDNRKRKILRVYQKRNGIAKGIYGINKM